MVEVRARRQGRCQSHQDDVPAPESEGWNLNQDLDPNYNMTRSNSGLNLRNCCRTVRAARFSLLSFGKPAWLCRSHQREHPLRGSSLNYSRFLCHLLIIQLSLYTLLTYFAHVCKLLVNLTSTTLNIPLGNENDALESLKHHDDQKANCCNELSY